MRFAVMLVLGYAGCTIDGEPADSPEQAIGQEAQSSALSMSEGEVGALSCSAYHGDVNGCNAAAGCAYYYCSNQCHPTGTSNCAAGCTAYCNCSAYHGDVNGCNAADGCAYYYCSNQCHPTGTSNCEAGCSAYCDCSAYDGDVNGCNAASGCAYYYCSNQCHETGTSNCAAGCTAYCPQLANRRAYVIIYDPIIPSTGQRLHAYFGWNDPDTLVSQYRSWISGTTGGMVSYDVAIRRVLDEFPVKADGYRYTASEYIACISGTGPCHDPDGVNYNALITSQGVCDQLNTGNIDEVWIFGGPYFGFYESTLAGPNGFWYNSPPVTGTTCNELVAIMGYNYERGLDSMAHNLGHRTESTMTQVYGSWNQNSLSHNWNRFGLVDFQSPSYGYSGCGSVHYPPNATSDYDYANGSVASSFCDDFYNYPNLATPSTVLQNVSCNTWGCTQIGYLTWWFEHIPHVGGSGPDGKYNNWWYYIVDPNEAL